MRCLVVCVDALDIRLIDKFKLFSKLRGQKGRVWTESAREGKPISSAKTWTCMYTGCTEKELDHLTYVQDREKKVRSNTVSDTGKDTIWKKLSDKGYRVGVLDGLVTDVESMPKKEGNFILTGIDKERQWYPFDLDKFVPIDRLSNALPYPVGYKTILGKDIPWSEIDSKELEEKMPNYYFGMSEFIKIRNSYYLPTIRTLNELQKPDFLLIFRYEIDHLCHMQYHEPGLHTVRRGYEYIEEFIYQLEEMLKPEHTLIISDHGMGDLTTNYAKHIQINGVTVDQAGGNAEVIVSCEHEGPGFYFLTGVDNSYKDINISDVFGIIESLF